MIDPQRRTVINPNKALWEKGDFTRIAQSMRRSGESLVNALGITKGLKILDLGCGDGTTALPAARLGADVLGVDIAGNPVQAGNQTRQRGGTDQLQALGLFSSQNKSPDKDKTTISATFLRVAVAVD